MLNLSMKGLCISVLLACPGPGGAAAALVHAGNPMVQNTSQASVMRDYLRNQKKQQRRFRQAQKQAENRLRKMHHAS